MVLYLAKKEKIADFAKDLGSWYNKFMLNAENTDLETNIFYKILKYILYALLLTPLWVWSAFLFPFITSKIIYFRILLELAVAVYIPLALKYPEIRPRWNWLTKAVWIYMGIILITSIFGVNFSKSFMGTIERGEGIVTLLHFTAFFTMLPAVFRSKADWTKYLTAALAMIVFVGLVGLIQIGCTNENGVQIEGFLCDRVPPTQGVRISATIGNASFFAAFMLFGVFLSWLLGLQKKENSPKDLSRGSIWAAGGFALAYLAPKFFPTLPGFFGILIFSFAYGAIMYGLYRLFLGSKWSSFAAIIFSIFILIETQTRGGAIALYLTVLLYLLFYILRGRAHSWRKASGAALILMIAVPAIVFTKPESLPAPVLSVPIVRRLVTISKGDVTTKSRLDTWNASWKGWQDRFWTGYGYENYNIAFNKYFPPKIFRDQGSQIWFDRAHNIIFDIALTSGIFGLAAYFGIFAAAFWVLYKLVRKSALDWKQAVVLFAAFVAYFVQNIFVFDTQATYLLFFILLAYLVFLRGTFPAGQTEAPIPGKSYDWGYLPPIAMAITTIASIYFINWQPAAANYFTTDGIKAAKLKQYRAVQTKFTKALSYGTYMDEEIRQRLVDYANEAAASGLPPPPERKELYQFVTDELKKNIASSPQDVKNYLYLMSTYNVASQELNSVDQVFELSKTALVLSPTRMQIYTELGQAAFLKDRQDEGLEYFRKAVELNHEAKEMRVNFILAGILAGREDIVQTQKQAISDSGNALGGPDYAAMGRAYIQIDRK